jgi:hypothetical protein
VAGRVQVLSVPAAGEEDLSTETVGAVDGGKTVGLGGGGTIVVEAVEADGLGLKVTSVVASEWVTRDHAEPSRESLQRVVVGTTTLKVVDGGTTEGSSAITGLGNSLEASILELEVELGSPVSREILADGARCAAGVAKGVIAGLETEAITTSDSVSVSGDLSGEDERVDTLINQAGRARHTPESSGWTGQSREGSHRG